MSTMGHVPTDDPTWICDNCEGTYTGLWAEVSKLGWCKHVKKSAVFIMCGDCEKDFAQRREAAEKAKA